MQFGSTTITTPFDNPPQYDPDWRNAFATAVLDYPKAKLDSEYVVYKNDPWIKKQISYLQAVRNKHHLTKEQQAYRLASLWFQGNRSSDVKYRLEPLLLTPIGFDIISLDIGGGQVDPSVFKIYERLYFSVRLESGKQNESCQLRQYFAMPQGQPGDDTPNETLWRVVGALMGYDTLVSMWLWNNAHGLANKANDYMLEELWRIAQSLLFLDVFAHRVDNRALPQLLGSFTDQTRMRRETGNVGVQGLETSKTLMAYLYAASPHIIGAAKDTDREQLMTSAIRDRLAAQRNVSMQDVVDRGVDIGEEGLNKQIAEHFKPKQLTE